MNAEAARRLSFYKWHRKDCLYATPKALAAAGFFHRPTPANLDRVACFTCTVCLVNWEAQDDPVQEHLKHGHACKFIHKTDLQNVSYEVTLSHLPLYSWSKICERSQVQVSFVSFDHTIPTLQLNSNDLIIGHLTPESTWFSVAIPSTSSKPSIFLFDTMKVAAKPIEILLDLYATCMVEQLGLSQPIANTTHKRSFDWLNSVEMGAEDSEPLCQIKAMTTSSSFDECTVTLRGEKILGVLVSSVAVDENQLKCEFEGRIEVIETASSAIQVDDKDPKLINTPTSTPLKRRPFILVHHIGNFILMRIP